MSLVTFNSEQALDRFLDTAPFFGFPQTNRSHDHSTVLPRVNIIETDEAFCLEAETPGMTDKDVSIEFNAGVLTLKSHQEQVKETDNYHVREFSNQTFERSFRLSDQIDPDKVTARMDRGILKITLPKKEQAKPKKIEIKLEP